MRLAPLAFGILEITKGLPARAGLVLRFGLEIASVVSLVHIRRNSHRAPGGTGMPESLRVLPDSRLRFFLILIGHFVRHHDCRVDIASAQFP